MISKTITTGNRIFHQTRWLPSLLTVGLLLCAVGSAPHTYAAPFEGHLNSVSITDSAGSNTTPTAVINFTQDGEIYSFDASKSTDR